MCVWFTAMENQDEVSSAVSSGGTPRLWGNGVNQEWLQSW